LKRVFVMLFAIVALLAAGCGGDGGGAAAGGQPAETTAAPAPASGAVRIAGFAFDPGSLRAEAGQSVTWTNQDDAPHTVTADDGAFDSGNLAGGEEFSFTFDQAGTFAYHCNIHQSMKGTVTVTG
jgi:plastocyanin